MNRDGDDYCQWCNHCNGAKASEKRRARQDSLLKELREERDRARGSEKELAAAREELAKARRELGWARAGLPVSSVKEGQVWLYQRTLGGDHPPVVHVITERDISACRSTSVFTDDGEANAETILSGAMREMEEGEDSAGSWTLLYDPATSN